MFVYLGQGAYGYRVYDSADEGTECYTEEQLRYALQVGSKIKYLDPKTLGYEGKIVSTERVYTPNTDLFAIKLECNMGNDVMLCEYHIYNLKTKKVSKLTQVPFLLKGMVVFLSSLVLKGDKYYYRFEAQSETAEGSLSVENKGSFTEGTTEAFNSMKFVRSK